MAGRYRGAGATPPRANTLLPPVRVDRGTGIILEFVGEGSFEMRGPRSGRTYHVNATGDLVLAHPDDVEEMVRRSDFTPVR